MATAAPPNPVLTALRIATSCTICLLLVTWWRLEHANLAVWTSYMVMAVVPITVFQRGFERALGRGLGILVAVALVAVFPDQVLVRLVIGSVLMLVAFYGYIAGRLSYAVINGTMYFMVLIQLARSDPAHVTRQGWEMFLAVLVGCLVSDVVVWATRAEATLGIDPGSQPLWPIRNDWLNRALMMIVTGLVTLRVCHYFSLPLGPTVISVMIISGNPDVHSMLLKGEMRLEGVIVGGAYGAAAFLLLALSPHLSVLTVLVFAGTFVAGYLSKTLGAHAYFGAQLGLVICLTIVVPPTELGSMTAALQRLAGILIAMAVVVVVPGLWPYVPFQAVTGSTATPPAGAARG
jgi:uncharacterized membrane protein YccC